MLEDIQELADQMLAVSLVFQDVIAYDVETQARLKKSNGRRKAGRPAKYYVLASNGRKYVYQNSVPSISMGVVCHFTAFTDDEAIMKANEMFPDKYRVFIETVYKEEEIFISSRGVHG